MKRFKWDKHYLYWGITAFCVIICSIAAFMAFNHWQSIASVLRTILGILSPFIYGLVIAYLLSPAVRRFERFIFSPLALRLFPKNPKRARVFTRALSLTAAILLTLLVIALLLVMLLPGLLKSLESLFTNMSKYIPIALGYMEKLIEPLNNPEFEQTAVNILSQTMDYFVDWLQTSFVPQVNAILASVSTGVFSMLTAVVNIAVGIVISVYILYNRESFTAQIKKFLYSVLKPKHVKGILDGLAYLDKSFGSFLIGKALDSAIVGLICLVFMSIMDMPYTTLISVVIGVTNMIPFFGPFIGAIPSALLLLMESPIQCLIFVIFIIILQQIDGNILGPKILSGTTGLTGFWVMFSILVGGGLFGFVGMLCGVPLFAVVYALIKRVCRRRLEKKGLPAETAAYMDISHIDPDTHEPVKRDGESGGEKPSE